MKKVNGILTLFVGSLIFVIILMIVSLGHKGDPYTGIKWLDFMFLASAFFVNRMYVATYGFMDGYRANTKPIKVSRVLYAVLAALAIGAVGSVAFEIYMLVLIIVIIHSIANLFSRFND